MCVHGTGRRGGWDSSIQNLSGAKYIHHVRWKLLGTNRQKYLSSDTCRRWNSAFQFFIFDLTERNSPAKKCPMDLGSIVEASRSEKLIGVELVFLEEPRNFFFRCLGTIRCMRNVYHLVDAEFRADGSGSSFATVRDAEHIADCIYDVITFQD